MMKNNKSMENANNAQQLPKLTGNFGMSEHILRILKYDERCWEIVQMMKNEGQSS